MRQIQLRLPDGMTDRADARAASVGLSRNEWMVRALRWALDQPIRETTVKEKL